jgi:hypothetical protein
MNRFENRFFTPLILTSLVWMALIAPSAAAVVCNPSGKYCGGTYPELVEWERHFASGEVHINPTQFVKDEIIATAYCSLHRGSYILVPASLPAGDRLLDRLLIAKDRGETVRIEWGTGASGDCELTAILFFGE